MSAGIFTILVSCGIVLVSSVGGTEPRRPNILIIIADDLGWADVGYHGSQIQTPHIDRLAREGVQLDQHYVTPMCSTTRVALLSGRFPSRFGIHGATNDQVLPFGTETLASALKGAGYDTGITGKWHLGSKPQCGPLKFGFRRSYGALAGGVDQYTHLYKSGPYSRTWHRNDQFVDEQGHSTDLIAREAIRWIEAKRERPFFIQVAFTAVHVPVQVPEQWMGRYEGSIDNRSYRRYAAYASHMDDAVGRMVQALVRTGQRENTLVVFVSDNGSFPRWAPVGKYPGTYEPCPVLGSNEPLRGYKREVYEGGIRTPALANWPGILKSGRLTAVLHIVDWMPTFTRLAGSAARADGRWDGRDIWPLLCGQIPKDWSRTLYWTSTGGDAALRHGDWKLIVHPGAGDELFNLAKDPGETANAAMQQPQRVAKLKALLQEQRRQDRARGAGFEPVLTPLPPR